MSARSLNPLVVRKAIAIARLLDSDRPGEAAAAALALKRLPIGVPFADLLERAFESALKPVPAPTPVDLRSPWDLRDDPMRPWRNKARMLAAFPQLLNETERRFAHDMMALRHEPSPRQWDWLDSLVARVEMRQAA